MSKKWTQRQARTGGTVQPDAINEELRAQQSSITTLDREQLPDDFADASRLTPYALQRVYNAPRFPATSGQQDATSSTTVASNMWLDSVTTKNDTGHWRNASAPITLTAFAGGHLFFEWSGNALVFPVYGLTSSMEYPFNPKYLGFRILVNNSVLTEARGAAYHESFRIFGGRLFPAGDLVVTLQFKSTQVGPDDPLVTDGGADIMQAHIYGMKYLAVGRFR
jgi:hypothetical protein